MVKHSRRRLSMQKDDEKAMHLKRITLSLSKPSYMLGLGSLFVRPEHRARLQRLLAKLMRTKNWSEACGVALLLLKGTQKETCPVLNRFKYSTIMELMKYARRGRMIDAVIGRIYDIWMIRAGISFKNRRRLESTEENILAVRLESIVYLILHGHLDSERDNARSLMQEHGYEKHSMLNLIVGMIFYHLWYSTIPTYLQLDISGETIGNESYDCNSVSGDRSELEDSKNVTSHCIDKVQSVSHCVSESSVQIDKVVKFASHEEDVSSKRNYYVKVEHSEMHQPRHIFTTYTDSEVSSDNDAEDIVPNITAFEKLERWILPLQTRDWKLDNVHLNDEYVVAVNCLREALRTKPMMAALLPLIQLLLISRDYKMALNELEKFCGDSSTPLTNRLKASLLELISPEDKHPIINCYENTLKHDPTCTKAVAKLVNFHKNGDYPPESLIESIAVHLEAAYPENMVWKEFAACFLNVFHSEEDRMSSCLPQKQYVSVRYQKIPTLFTHGQTGRAWRLRWRWWRRRHFSACSLAADHASGDMELLAYKAASAVHMYGVEFDYVRKACDVLVRESRKDLILSLKVHLRCNSCLHFCFKDGT